MKNSFSFKYFACIIVFFIVVSCDRSKNLKDEHATVDSIVIYKKWRNNTEGTSSIRYYYKNINKSNVAYLMVNDNKVPLYQDNNGGFGFEVLRDNNQSLNDILLTKNDLVNFKSAILLDYKSQIIDTVYNYTKPILYLEEKKISLDDSINLNKTNEPLPSLFNEK